MSIENLTIVKLKDSWYASGVQDLDDNVIYCEIQYKRDRSSFAGMAFKLKENNNVTVRECEERMTRNSMTVGDWKNKFKRQYPGYDVIVYKNDGCKARGQSKLCTVRDTYLEE